MIYFSAYSLLFQAAFNHQSKKYRNHNLKAFGIRWKIDCISLFSRTLDCHLCSHVTNLQINNIHLHFPVTKYSRNTAQTGNYSVLYIYNYLYHDIATGFAKNFLELLPLMSTKHTQLLPFDIFLPNFEYTTISNKILTLLKPPIVGPYHQLYCMKVSLLRPLLCEGSLTCGTLLI